MLVFMEGGKPENTGNNLGSMARIDKITLGPSDLKIGHLGQVCTLYTFLTKLYTLPWLCLDHFHSKKLSKFHIVTSYLMTSQKRGIQIF